MEIKKIDLIEIWTYSNFIWDNFLCYQTTQWTQIYNLWKINLFFWENWTGKTTITKLFRFINWDASYEKIIKPRWKESIDYRIYDNNWNIIHKFTNKIKIFDKRYIKDQVWDIVDDQDESTEQKKSRWEHFLLLWDFIEKERIIRGKEKNISIREQKYKTDKTIFDEKDANYKNQYWNNYKEIFVEINNEEYSEEILKNELDKINDNFNLKKKILNESNKIADMNDNTSKLTNIQPLENDVWSCFSKTIQWSISFDYNEKFLVKELIEIIKNNSLNKCLLCNQNIKDWDLYIERIESLFSEFFSEHIDNISSNLLNISKTICLIEWIITTENEILSKNKNIYEDYKQIKWDKSIVYPDFNFVLNEDTSQTIKLLKALIEKKQSKLSEWFEIWDIQGKFNWIIDNINVKINCYNNILKNIDDEIKELKENSKLWINLDNLQLDVKLAENKLKIFNEKSQIQSLIENENKLKKEFEDINKEKTNINIEKDDIKKDFWEFTQKYWKIIEELIKEINPWLADRIDFDLQWTYTQWKWRCWFEIKHSWSSQNVCRSLSEWEKRAIAFAYFLSQFYEIKNKKLNLKEWEYNDYILVFDDPSTDYDKNNKYIIASEIIKLSNPFKQIFIFTHDEKFAEYIGRWKNIIAWKWDLCKFKITKNYLWQSFISTFEKDQTELYHDHLINALNEKNPDLSSNAFKLRYCVESMIHRELLWESESSFNKLVENKLSWNWFKHIEKINQRVETLKELYQYCNENWSHYWDADGFVSLSKYIIKYFEMYDYVFDTKYLHQINQQWQEQN